MFGGRNRRYYAITDEGKEDDYSYDISSSSGDIKVNGHKSEKTY